MAQHRHWLPPALCKLQGQLWAASASLTLCSCSLRVAEKLPAAHLLLLQRLLSLLQNIGHHVSTSRMTSSNLAICLGPNLLGPPDEELLPLEAALEVTEKVRCTDRLAAACLDPQSLLLSCANAGGVAAWKSSPTATAFCAEARLRSGKGCLTCFQTPALKPRL